MRYIVEQIRLIKEKDSSIHSRWKAILTPGFRAIIYYKVARFFYLRKLFFIYKESTILNVN